MTDRQTNGGQNMAQPAGPRKQVSQISIYDSATVWTVSRHKTVTQTTEH